MRILKLAIAASLLGCNPDPYPGEQGDILHFGLRQLPKSMDPPHIEDEGSGKVSTPVYEGLLAYHPFARPYALQPGLAAEMPTVSEDGLTYTFRLKKGVKFHDNECFPGGKGRELTAHDFVFAFKRFAHPTTKAQGYWLMDEKMAGLEAWRDELREEIAEARKRGEEPGPLYNLEKPVEAFKAVDDYTLELKLAGPYPQFLWVLAMNYTSVYPREAVEMYGSEFRNNPVGTGPFMLTEYNPVYRAVYTKNPTFRDERFPDPAKNPSERWDGWQEDQAKGLLADAGKQIPMLDGLEIRFILEDQPRWLYFKAGYTDFLNPPKDNVAEAIPGGKISDEMAARGTRLEKWTELGTVYTCLNTEDELLSNVDVRRAMALAYDHNWTVDNLYSGQALIAKSPIPPGVAGYDADYHPYHTDSGGSDIERAKKLLARAGYPDGIDPKTGKALRITFENSGAGATQRMFGNRFIDEMRRIGIEVDVVVNTFPQMIDKMRKKSYQVAGLAWGFDYPDAQNILQLLYGPNKAPGIGSSNFDDPTFNRLYDEAAVLPDGPERTALYEEMTHIIGDQVPWITRAHRIRPNLQHPWLRGFKYTEVSDHYWRYAAVDDEMRDKLLAEWNQPTRWPIYLFFAAFGGLVVVSVMRGRAQ